MQQVTSTCDDCGTDFEHGPMTPPPKRCSDCQEEQMIEQLRECLDPDHDGTFSRPSALMRLKNEYDQMPIVDFDDALITSLLVEPHPSGDRLYVEKITQRTDCPECGYGKAYSEYQSNAGHHTFHVWDCPSCGFYEHTG